MLGLDNPIHIAIVLMVVLMVFGAKRLPEMGRSMGEGMRGFKHAINGEAPEPAQPILLSDAQAAATVSEHQAAEPTVR